MRAISFDQLHTQTRIENYAVTDVKFITLWTPRDLTLEQVDFTNVTIGNSNFSGTAAKRTQLFLLLSTARYKRNVCITAPQAMQLCELLDYYQGKLLYGIASIGIERSDASFEEYDRKLKALCERQNLSPFHGVEIKDDALTIAEIIKLYALGARQFNNIPIRAGEHWDHEPLPLLEGAEFDDRCAVSFGRCLNPSQQFYVSYADFRIPILSASNTVTDTHSDIFCAQPQATRDFLILWTGKDKSALAARALSSQSKFLGADHNTAVLTLLFNDHQLLHRTYHARNKTTFDLGTFQTRIGNSLYHQQQFVEALLSIDFGEAPFAHGIHFPAFILNQCNHPHPESLASTEISVALLRRILEEVKIGLVRLQRQGFVSTHLNSRDIRIADHLSLQGCMIEGDIKFFTTLRELSHFKMQHTVCEGVVDFSNVIFHSATFEHTTFKKGIEINIATDFRGVNPSVHWPDDMPIIFIDEKGHKLPSTVSDFLTRLENKYYDLRKGGRHGGIGRSDFFKTKVHAESHPGKTNGEKLLSVLSHIQSERNFITKKLESRTYNALMGILPGLADTAEEKRQADSRAQAARERAEMLQKMREMEVQQSAAAAATGQRDSEAEAILQKRIDQANAVKSFFTAEGVFLPEKVLQCDIQTLADIGKQYRTVTLTDTFSDDVVKPACELFLRELTRALSSFDSPDILGQDTHYNPDQCASRTNELIAQYRFLKLIAGEDKPFLHTLNPLIQNIFIHFVKHVANREKYLDAEGRQNRWLRHDFLIQLFTESNINREIHSLRVHANHRTMMNAHATDRFFSSATPSGVEYIKTCRILWLTTSVADWEKSGCIDQVIISAVKSKLVYSDNALYAHQLLIAEYLKRGEMKKAVAEIQVLRSQNNVLDRIVTDEIKTITDRAIDEAQKICRGESSHKQYVSDPENAPAFTALCKFNALYNDTKLGERIALIREGIHVTLAITKMIGELIKNDKKIRITTLQSFLSCEKKSFVWLGEALIYTSGLLQQSPVIFSSGRKALADQLIRLLRSAKTIDAYEGDKIGVDTVPSTRVVLDSLCQVDFLKTHLSLLLQPFYVYKPFEKAIVDGKLKLDLPANTPDIANPSVNHPKYLLALHLQNTISSALPTLTRVRDPYRILDALGMIHEEIQRAVSAFETGGHLYGEKNGRFHKLLFNEKSGEARGLFQTFCDIEAEWKRESGFMFHYEERAHHYAPSL